MAGHCILYPCAGHQSCVGLYCTCTTRFGPLAKAISSSILYVYSLTSSTGSIEHQCCESANSGLPVSLFKGKCQEAQTELQALVVSSWELRDEQVSGTGSCEFNTDSDTFPCSHHNQKHFFVLVFGVFWGVFYHKFSLLILTPKHLHPGRCVAVMLGPTATQSCAALKRGGTGGNAGFQMPPPIPLWDRAWRHTQGQPRAMRSHTTDRQHRAAQLLGGKQKVFSAMPE